MQYRTTPLRGLFARMKGGFYDDWRFTTLRDVIERYNTFQRPDLDEQQKNDLRNT